jgi:hypothetical protein
MYKAITIVFYFIISFKAAVVAMAKPAVPLPMKKNPFSVEHIKENNNLSSPSSEEDNVLREFSENLDRLNRLRDLTATLPVEQSMKKSIFPRTFDMRAGGMKEYSGNGSNDSSNDGFY